MPEQNDIQQQAQLDKIKHVLAYCDACAQNSGGDLKPLSQEQIKNLIEAVKTADSNEPILKMLKDPDYERWWKQQPERSNLSDKDLESEWKNHREQLEDDDKDIKSGLSNFASNVSNLQLDDGKKLKDDVINVLIAVGNVVSITTNMLSMVSTPTSDGMSHVSKTKSSIFFLNNLVDTVVNIKRGQYEDASINFSRTVVSATNFSIALNNTAQKFRRLLDTSQKIAPVSGRMLPFVGLGINAASSLLNEYRIYKLKKDITKIEAGFDNAKDRKDLREMKQNFIDKKASLNGLERSRVSSGIYAAMGVATIVITATAASVMSAGLAPAALAVGMGVVSLAVMAGEHFLNRGVQKSAKEQKLNLYFSELKEKNGALSENSKLNLDFPLKSVNTQHQDDNTKYTFGNYIEDLVKNDPSNAQKVLEQLETLLEAQENLDNIDENDASALLIAKERVSIEQSSMKLLLREINSSQNADIDPEMIFDNMLSQQDVVNDAPELSDLENRLAEIEPELKNMSGAIGVDLTKEVATPGERPKSVMSYLYSLAMIKPDIAEPVVDAGEKMVAAHKKYESAPERDTFKKMYLQKAFQVTVNAFKGALEFCQKSFGKEVTPLDKGIELMDASKTDEATKTSVIDNFKVREAATERPTISEQLDSFEEDFDVTASFVFKK